MVIEGQFPTRQEELPKTITAKRKNLGSLLEQLNWYRQRSDGRKHPRNKEVVPSPETLDIFYRMLILSKLKFELELANEKKKEEATINTEDFLREVTSWKGFSKDIFSKACREIKDQAES